MSKANFIRAQIVHIMFLCGLCVFKKKKTHTFSSKNTPPSDVSTALISADKRLCLQSACLHPRGD